jgi:hypothetical protein
MHARLEALVVVTLKTYCLLRCEGLLSSICLPRLQRKVLSIRGGRLFPSKKGKLIL